MAILGDVGLSRNKENLKSPDHCDPACPSAAPGTNNNTLKPKVPANIISNEIGC